jgi:hypothetical protein
MIEPLPISTLNGIEDNLGGFPNSGSFIFRGLSSKYNSIKPSLYYNRNLTFTQAQKIENHLISNFIDILEKDFNIKGERVNSSSIETWLIARHFHLASRFVEFSRDFSVALQFSFEYAKESNDNAYLWVLKSESNPEIKRLDPNNCNSINPFDLDDYYLLNPPLLLAKENSAKLAYDRMFIQNSIFLLQPLSWSSIPITNKINKSLWKLFEIRQEHFSNISNEVTRRYGVSMTMNLLMKSHPLDEKCKELNKIEKV